VTERSTAGPVLTAFALAERFIGLREVPGLASNPELLAMLRLDAAWPDGDHVPWCSAFVNYIAWLAGLPRSRSLLARSWLGVGRPIGLQEARPGWDVVVLRLVGRGQAGPELREAPGHVGFYAGHTPARIALLGGNQQNTVSVMRFPLARLLGLRRLHE
jgi:uncharacterized protein (TIGR02594 family)